MPRFSGFRCDVCTTVAEGSGRDKNETPAGWITVEIKMAGDLHEGIKLMCSNRCLKKWATERVKVEQDEKKIQSATKRGAAAAAPAANEVYLRQQNHVRNHTNGRTDPDCLYCEAPS